MSETISLEGVKAAFVGLLTAISVCGLSTLIGTQTLHVDVLEGDIAGLEDDGMPEGRVGDGDTVNRDVLASCNCKGDGSSKDTTTATGHSRASLRLSVRCRQELNLGIEQEASRDSQSRICVPPDLARTIDPTVAL